MIEGRRRGLTRLTAVVAIIFYDSAFLSISPLPFLLMFVVVIVFSLDPRGMLLPLHLRLPPIAVGG